MHHNGVLPLKVLLSTMHYSLVATDRQDILQQLEHSMVGWRQIGILLDRQVRTERNFAASSQAFALSY